MMDGARPNVVVILADDLGWGDLGCYGAELIPTPAVDRLAAGGARLTDCHAPSAVCTPSRYGLLTGRYCWRSPLKTGVLLGHSPAIIERDRPTLASALSADGYATAAIGKWHLGLGWSWQDGSVWDQFDLPLGVSLPDIKCGTRADYTRPFRHGPLELGFDHFFGMTGSLDMPPYCYLTDDRPLVLPDRQKVNLLPQQTMGRQSPDWVDEEVDIRFARETCDWIRQQAATDRPFFVYHATSAPHRPLAVPELVRGASRAGDRGDLVCLVDWVVDQVCGTLDELGIADNTIVVLTSDNGAMPIDIEGRDFGHPANGPWRGRKGDSWEGGHRIPFIVRWPGRIPAGTVIDDLFCLTDLFPTITAATGSRLPAGAAPDGTDLLPLLLAGSGSGPAGQPYRDSVVHHSAAGWFGLRTGELKTIFGTGSGGTSRPLGQRCGPDWAEGQLYDLGTDPYETTNLWSERHERVVAAHAAIRDLCVDPSSGFPFDIPIHHRT
ncbi:sulfatase family protein [Propionibacteriaceae bacterium Y2011]